MERYFRYDGRKVADDFDAESERKYVILYKLGDKGLDKIHGYIKTMRHSKSGIVPIFKKTDDSNCIDRMAVSNEEYTIYRNSLWMVEENDELAASLFIEYKKKSLKSLEEKVKETKGIIKKLQKNISK